MYGHSWRHKVITFITLFFFFFGFLVKEKKNEFIGRMVTYVKWDVCRINISDKSFKVIANLCIKIQQYLCSVVSEFKRVHLLKLTLVVITITEVYLLGRDMYCTPRISVGIARATIIHMK